MPGSRGLAVVITGRKKKPQTQQQPLLTQPTRPNLPLPIAAGWLAGVPGTPWVVCLAAGSALLFYGIKISSRITFLNRCSALRPGQPSHRGNTCLPRKYRAFSTIQQRSEKLEQCKRKCNTVLQGYLLKNIRKSSFLNLLKRCHFLRGGKKKRKSGRESSQP